ncbi:MAG TPA: ABC transporter substrate-binding protein [Myxococcota bacterium]|nr:ABC transporter substrate-binding protein [Myxococcota bacterium]
MKRRLGAVAFAAALALSACSNDPYPDADDSRAIFYTVFDDPPKTLDPQVAYSVIDHSVIGNVYDTLLQYHYLKRPYTLMPGLLEEIPRAEPQPDGRVAYTLRLRRDLRFHEDPCFERSSPGSRTRDVTAADVAFAFARIGDPAVDSPVLETLVKISGMREFGENLTKRRKEDASFAALRIDRQYAEIGGIAGVRVASPRELVLVLDEPYPQIRFWLAMPFTSPVPWEAVAWYDGHEGRELFAEHPVGTGPFRLTRYEKRSRIVMEREPSWYGARDPGAPGTVYPTDGEPSDVADGYLDPARVGKPLPFLERIEFRREKEDIPAFTKFLQGYYDLSGIPQESFDRMVHEGALSPEMSAQGMRLAKAVGADIYYIGFNMDDPTVGAPAGERGRKLRQAMSLVADTVEFERLFTNGRGIPAQSPLPPGIFGYDPDYRNPYRKVDPTRAAQLLAEAGYPGGIDPSTGQALRLSFDTPATDTRSLLTFQFWVGEWRRLGLDVQIAATSYNQFQDKVRRGAFQIFQYGWVADYPDPENFLFLLWSGMARTKNGGPNTANYQDPRYDALFEQMKARDDDPERLRLIGEMRAILERDCPWIPLFHREGFALYQAWVAPPKPVGMAFAVDKYRQVDPTLRTELRAAWNQPIRWPAYALAIATVAVVLPGIATWRRERA